MQTEADFFSKMAADDYAGGRGSQNGTGQEQPEGNQGQQQPAGVMFRNRENPKFVGRAVFIGDDDVLLRFRSGGDQGSEMETLMTRDEFDHQFVVVGEQQEANQVESSGAEGGQQQRNQQQDERKQPGQDGKQQGYGANPEIGPGVAGAANLFGSVIAFLPLAIRAAAMKMKGGGASVDATDFATEVQGLGEGQAVQSDSFSSDNVPPDLRDQMVDSFRSSEGNNSLNALREHFQDIRDGLGGTTEHLAMSNPNEETASFLFDKTRDMADLFEHHAEKLAGAGYSGADILDFAEREFATLDTSHADGIYDPESQETLKEKLDALMERIEQVVQRIFGGDAPDNGPKA